MADVIECWLKGEWDLSFLDPDPMRFKHSFVDDQDQRTNRTACNDSRHCSRKQNSLALIVRRRRSHSYAEISPLPLPLPLHSRKFPSTPENAEPQTDRCCSDSSTDHSILPSHPVYENLTEPPPALPPRLTVSTTGSRRCPGVVVVGPLVQLSPPPSSTGSRLLRPAAAFCRISASPAADDCSAFSYCRDSKTNAAAPPSKLELCQWRRRQCFSAWGEEVLTKTFDRLSVCGFYFGRSSFDDAKRLLRRSAVGTFLLRDSADDGVPFSLSVQTQRGVTSIRIICCESGRLFRLDSEQEQMPTFDCVVQLIQFYVNQSTNSGALNNFVLLQMNGQRDHVPVLLRRPLERRPSTLRHLCRKTINRTIGNRSVNRLHLIPSLKVFLTDYPYDI